VLLYKQTAEGWEETVLASDLKAPAHATAVDMDGDGRLDIVVAVLGSIFPWDELVGSVVLLENEGGAFIKHEILTDVRRVADVQAGDLNGNGKMDLAVAVFGYARGEVLWLENMGKQEGRWRFRDHQLLSRPGAIHVPIGDLDGNGKLDIAAVVSQDEEELWVFRNMGEGVFEPKMIYATSNFDVGSAGLLMVDLNQNGRLDLLLPQGDNLEDPYAWPQPYHGCIWFENLGGWEFRPKQIARFGGTYAAGVGDLNGNGFLDVVLVSFANDPADPRHSSVVWLENDGRQNFTTHHVDNSPAGLVTVAVGDLTGNGRPDIVAGGLSLPPIYPKKVERLTYWKIQ
jgi:hypothetical protein